MTLRCPPSLHPGLATQRSAEALDAFLKQRWVQVLLFLGVFLAAWLMGPRIAHAFLVA